MMAELKRKKVFYGFGKVKVNGGRKIKWNSVCLMLIEEKFEFDGGLSLTLF